uniref:Large ribosomal subunit protein uL4c n=1 Tax=Gracilariopsis longissima TaxID=172976 RepID=A0A345U9N5_9FLOR|nr:ribosomal protein L4 [Gracilariopsis longissima]AXI97171.1 ribosomal protein L4 [Gracilariopsis longissima]UAD89087.1 ribosomal protein L4 [Gracilariopsis longissima]
MSIKKKLIYSIISSEDKKPKYKKEITLQLNKHDDHNMYIIHRALIHQLHNYRQGNANTKTRREVQGGGKKPWKQKGTGRARAGSIRSPLWKGGGVIFGPRTIRYKKKINKKEKKLALRIMLYNKFQNTVVTEYITNNLEKPSTKLIINTLKKYNLNVDKPKNILIIVGKKTQNLYLSTRNLHNVELIAANHLNIVSLLKAENILMTIDALDVIQNTYND